MAHYAAYPEVAEWLQQHWEPEELQHGRALRRYVEAVWPEFDWPAAYDSFFAEYSRLCTTEELEGEIAEVAQVVGSAIGGFPTETCSWRSKDREAFFSSSSGFA